ncbi:MAG: MOSC domain-containing protein [Streptosporangiaceae bacterium]
MDSGQVISVNTGRAVKVDWAGRLQRTAIEKHPAGGAVHVGRLGLDGDEQADLENHGGPEQAIYVYAREDLDWWAGQLFRPVRDGLFGENITTAGLDVTNALIGERWRLGTAEVQVTSCRIPCGTFRSWTGEKGWVKRFAQAGRPGAYLRVLAEGIVRPGDPVTVLSRPAARVRVTVAESMRAFYGDQELLVRLSAVPERSSKWDITVNGAGDQLGPGPAAPASPASPAG